MTCADVHYAGSLCLAFPVRAIKRTNCLFTMWRVAVTVEGRTRAPAPSTVQDRLRACLLAQEACSWRLRSAKRWDLPCPTISTHLRPILAVLAGGGHPHIMQTRCRRCRGNARSPSPVASISTRVGVTRSVSIKGRDDQIGPLFPRRPRHRTQEVTRNLLSAKGGHDYRPGASAVNCHERSTARRSAAPHLLSDCRKEPSPAKDAAKCDGVSTT